MIRKYESWFWVIIRLEESNLRYKEALDRMEQTWEQIRISTPKNPVTPPLISSTTPESKFLNQRLSRDLLDIQSQKRIYEKDIEAIHRDN